MKIRAWLIAGALLAQAGYAQTFYPAPGAAKNAASLEDAKKFVKNYDPAARHFPLQAIVKDAAVAVNQPLDSYCTRDPKIDSFASYRYSSDFTPQEKNIVRAALETSKVCGGPFSGTSNPFGRVPQGVPLTSLRSVVGKKVRVVDYRLATEAERASCTKEIVRPLPKFVADYTFMHAYVRTAYVAYDIGPNGVVVNARDFGPSVAAMRDVPTNISAGALQAAATSRFHPPVLDGVPLYCINITEQINKLGDGDGGMQSSRSYVDIFQDVNGIGF